MSPKLTINLDGIPDIGIMPEPGKHRAKLVSCEEDVSQSSGNDMYVWLWEVIAGDSIGRRIKSYTTLAEDALGGLKMHFKAFGVPDGEEVDVDTDEFVDRTAIILCVSSKYRDRDSGEEKMGVSVGAVFPDDESAPVASSGGGKKRVLGSKNKGKDDIPF